jgi:CHAT domain-containing protein
LAKGDGDRSREASVLVELAALHLQLRETAAARERLVAALALARALGDVDLEARALGWMGTCHRYEGEPAKALEVLHEAVRLCRLRGNQEEEARSLSRMGMILIDRGDMQEALDVLRRALTLRREVGDRRRAFRGAADMAARELSRMVLGPVADLLGGRRLVVVAEGALQYVPMAALPHPAGEIGAAPLIVTREVVQLPSASSLAFLRRDLAGRTSAPRLVAVLSDPVFRADDPRLGAGPSRAAATSAPSVPADEDVTRAVADAGLGPLERLRFSRREADAIVGLVQTATALKALDFAANRATATSPSLRDYRIVHFATHGLLNSRHPELSGIVLSLVDEKGERQDGFLRLGDLYNLKLGAELVVLSACQTALGKQVKGEGLVGLTRGFFYAGAPRVIASLWSVRDEATAALMTRFYSTLLRDGKSPAAALRAAQVSLWKEPRWSAPYYWAGFILQGEWRATKSPAP